MVDGPAGMQFKVPTRINDQGEIAIEGILANRDYHATMLIPSMMTTPASRAATTALWSLTQARRLVRTRSERLRHNAIPITVECRIQGLADCLVPLKSKPDERRMAWVVD